MSLVLRTLFFLNCPRQHLTIRPLHQACSSTADLSLLGLEANISVPAESDKTKVVAMFAQLDSAVRELREENKQLR